MRGDDGDSEACLPFALMHFHCRELPYIHVMKKAHILLALIALFGLAGGALAYFTPKVYYQPTVEGGMCTVATTPYYSVVPDIGNNAAKGKRVALATKPGACGVFIIVGE
jgi:hypothetical protein